MRPTTVYGSGKVFFVMFSRCQYFIIFNKVDDTLYNTFVLLFQKSAIEFLRAPQEKSKTKQKNKKIKIVDIMKLTAEKYLHITGNGKR